MDSEKGGGVAGTATASGSGGLLMYTKPPAVAAGDMDGMSGLMVEGEAAGGCTNFMPFVLAIVPLAITLFSGGE